MSIDEILSKLVSEQDSCFGESKFSFEQAKVAILKEILGVLPEKITPYKGFPLDAEDKECNRTIDLCRKKIKDLFNKGEIT